MRYYKLTYTNIYSYSKQRTRLIKAKNKEEAIIWFENNLDCDNLLDWIDEVSPPIGVFA